MSGLLGWCCLVVGSVSGLLLWMGVVCWCWFVSLGIWCVCACWSWDKFGCGCLLIVALCGLVLVDVVVWCLRCVFDYWCCLWVVWLLIVL